MAGIPPLNMFGRQAPMVHIPYIHEPHYRVGFQHPKYTPHFDDRFDGHHFPYERPPLGPIPYDQHPRGYPQPQQQLMQDRRPQEFRQPSPQRKPNEQQQPVRDGRNPYYDQLLPYYLKHDRQQLNQAPPSQPEHQKNPQNQYGPPPDWYESKEIRKSLHQQTGQNEDKENNRIDPLNTSQQQKKQTNEQNKDNQFTDYPFIQPTLGNKEHNNRNPYYIRYPEDYVQYDGYRDQGRYPHGDFQEPVHLPDPDQFEEPAPMIDFYPPQHLHSPMYPQEEVESIDHLGRLHSYQQKLAQNEIAHEYTNFIREQVWAGERCYPEDTNDRAVMRKRWEIKEIYGNLRAEIDARGNIVFNNIKGLQTIQKTTQPTPAQAPGDRLVSTSLLLQNSQSSTGSGPTNRLSQSQTQAQRASLRSGQQLPQSIVPSQEANLLNLVNHYQQRKRPIQEVEETRSHDSN